MAAESYSLDEFSTGAWADRPEYASQAPGFDHVQAVHCGAGALVDNGPCGTTGYWYFLHFERAVAFQYYLYNADGHTAGRSKPVWLEPFFWVYGSIGDGARECSGGQNFSGTLPDMADALRWVDGDIKKRWPQVRQ